MSEEFKFIPGFNNDPLPCNSCIKSDVCRKEKENMMRLRLALERNLDCVIFPSYAKIGLQCKYYYPDLTGRLCE